MSFAYIQFTPKDIVAGDYDVSPFLSPTQVTPKSAGWDLRTAITQTIKGQHTAQVKTGVHLKDINHKTGVVLLIKERSGWCMDPNRSALLVRAGVVDQDYQGEIKVILTNISSHDICIRAGEKIAQLILLYTVDAYWHVLPPDHVHFFSPTKRGSAGLGGMDDQATPPKEICWNLKPHLPEVDAIMLDLDEEDEEELSDEAADEQAAIIIAEETQRRYNTIAHYDEGLPQEQLLEAQTPELQSSEPQSPEQQPKPEKIPTNCPGCTYANDH